MSEENTGFWSTVCSIFSMSKSAVKLTNTGIDSLTKGIVLASDNYFHEKMMEQAEKNLRAAEKWCKQQKDPVINELRGRVAMIAYDYFCSSFLFISYNEKSDYEEALAKKSMLNTDISSRIDKMLY